MKKSNTRADRMADQIHRDVMTILRTKVKDPRVIWVTVNDVQITKDYAQAKIYYSTLENSRPAATGSAATKIKESLLPRAKKADVAKALESAKGFIRSELSKGLTTYTVPQLCFIFDESLERGSHILSLINKVSDAYLPDENDADEKDPQ